MHKFTSKDGLIDKTGKEITPLKYAHILLIDTVEHFYDVSAPLDEEVTACYFFDGLAAVNLGGTFEEGDMTPSDGKWGFIDKTGKEVIPCKFDEILKNDQYGYIGGKFTNGKAKVRVGKRIFNIDKKGRQVGLDSIIKEEERAVKEIISSKYTYESGTYSEGLMIVANGMQWGYIDSTGKEVVPPTYVSAGEFSDGLAVVETIDAYGNFFGFIDKTGKIIIPIKYCYAASFSEGLAAVGIRYKSGNKAMPYYRKYGFIDKTGQEIIPLKYSMTAPFSEGLAAACLDGKWGFIDRTGKEIIPFIYESNDANLTRFQNGKVYVKFKGKGFYIDKNGKEVK